MTEQNVTQKFVNEAVAILELLDGHLEKVKRENSFGSLLTLRKMNKLTNQLAGASFVIEFHHIAQIAELFEEITHLVVGKTDPEIVNEGIRCFERSSETLKYYVESLKADKVEINTGLVRDLTSYIDKLGGARKRLTQAEIDKLMKRRIKSGQQNG